MDHTIRNTYDQLISARNAQLQFMASVRQRNSEFAFIVSPDLVVQYNYVHRLMKPLNPPDICAVDGGITCANLSALKANGDTRADDKVFNASGGGSAEDFLASRIIDLLDRPVDGNDAAPITGGPEVHGLISLFEERYRMCKERCDSLENELSTVERRLAAATTASTPGNETEHRDTMRSLRERVGCYEMQTLAVRRHLQLHDEVIRRKRTEIEDLLRKRHERDGFGDAVLRVLLGLFDSLETERDRVLTALTKTTSGDVTKRSSEQVDDEVNSRVKVLHDRMRGEVDNEIARLRRLFDEEVETRVAQKYAALPAIDLTDIDTLRRIAGADLRHFKSALDGIFELKESAFTIVPMLPQYEFRGCDRTLVKVYEYLGCLLEKMRDVYKFMIAQSGYLKSIGVTAFLEYVPLESMTRERTKKFIDQIHGITSDHLTEKRSLENGVLALLSRVLEELQQIKNGLKTSNDQDPRSR